ncbi:MAG: hypothetical protein IPN19_05525 [Elusimicrobia bacterium]|nr:hypothetical protein [Elusimicrobiota bacterium]
MAIVFVGTQGSVVPLYAASDERKSDQTQGSSYSLDQIQKAQASASAFVAQSNAAQASMGLQLNANNALTPGQQAAQAVQAEISAVRVGTKSGNKTITRPTVMSTKTVGDKTTTVLKYPGGQTQTTVATTDLKTGKVVKSSTHLRNADGKTLATAKSTFAYDKDGRVTVNTTLVEGKTTVVSVAVRDLYGNVTITGTEVTTGVINEHLHKPGVQITTFNTIVDSKGSFTRTFSSKFEGLISPYSNGDQTNNVTTMYTRNGHGGPSSGSSEHSVITRNADGTITTSTTIHTYNGQPTVYEKVEKADGVDAVLSPFEPPRFIVENLDLINQKRTDTMVYRDTLQVQVTENTLDVKTGNVVKSTTHLKDAKGKTIAKGTSTYSYRKDGNVVIKSTLVIGKTTVESEAVRTPRGHMTIKGTERTTGVEYAPGKTGVQITTFETNDLAMGDFTRTFKTSIVGQPYPRSEGIQKNNVTTTTTILAKGGKSWRKDISTLSSDGTKLRTVSELHGVGKDGKPTVVKSVSTTKGFTAYLDPRETERFIAIR